MSYHVERLQRPYDFRGLIQAYIYTQRQDFVHRDFGRYYGELLKVLETQFGVRLARDGVPSHHRVLWFLFDSTVSSLLAITTPWSGYLEAGLLHTKLDQLGEPGKAVYRASCEIEKVAGDSEAAHRKILETLFVVFFGDCQQIITSEDLKRAGFDDSREPTLSDYYDYM